MFNIIVTATTDLEETLTEMDRVTNQWEEKAAKGEGGWICADCCSGCSAGMPNECVHGVQWCTDIIKAFKHQVNNPVAKE